MPYIYAATNSNTDMKNCTSKGFRLPMIAEWSCAACYKGNDRSNGAYEYPVSSGNWWTPGDYASGATADCTDSTATEAVAIYAVSDTAQLKSKTNGYNTLGLFDMSGNVREFNFEWHPLYEGKIRLDRGGFWDGTSGWTKIGYWGYLGPTSGSTFHGFRLVKTR